MHVVSWIERAAWLVTAALGLLMILLCIWMGTALGQDVTWGWTVLGACVVLEILAATGSWYLGARRRRDHGD